MRRPLPGELVLLARMLADLSVDERERAAAEVLCQVDAADRYCLARGRLHPVFGDGSLAGRLSACKVAPLVAADDPDFLASMLIAVQAILNHTARQATDCAPADEGLAVTGRGRHHG